MQELKELATYAAQNNIRGSTFKRNSLLKPLDIILQELNASKLIMRHKLVTERDACQVQKDSQYDEADRQESGVRCRSAS